MDLDLWQVEIPHFNTKPRFADAASSSHFFNQILKQGFDLDLELHEFQIPSDPIGQTLL